MIKKVILYRFSTERFFVCDMKNKRRFSSKLASYNPEISFLCNIYLVCGDQKKYHNNTGRLLQGKQPQYRLKCHTQLVCDIFKLV